MPDTSALQRLLAELKRRHVFRVMAVYGVVGFGVLQVVELILPALLLPEWTYRLVALILLIGFPVAIVLAWAFEMTPAGVQRTRAASDDEIRRSVEAPAAHRWPIGLAALAGAVLLGLGTWWVLRPEARAAAPVYDSIAVLPFTNLTGNEEAEYLGDGLAEELLNALAEIEGLKVASRTAAFSLKNAEITPQAIGDSLNVALVLEGSVRGAGDRLRITAQLIDTENGYHVWSKSYDRPRSDLLDLQEELTGRIVDALAVRLDASGVARLANRGTRDPDAYDLYLQGRHFWNKRSFSDLQVAIGLFEKAIEADPSYAPAYAAIAESYAVPAGWGDDPSAALNEAERYARLALDRDPTLAQAHTALAYTYTMRDLDFRRAEQGFSRAIELDGNYATAHQWFAELLSAMDRHDEAVAEVRRAEALDPTPIIVWNVGLVLYHAGRYEEAIEQVGGTEAVDVFAEMGGRNLSIVLASLHALEDYDRIADVLEGLPPPPAEFRDEAERELSTLRSGSVDEKRRTTIEILEPSRPESVDAFDRRRSALVWLPVDRDSAFARLRLAGDSITVTDRITWFLVLQDSRFDVLRDDPRYAELDARLRR